MARNQELYPTDFPEITPSPQAVLRSHLPDVGDLGLQEADVPEGLGAYTQEDVGAPVSDEQAQRWMEETQIKSARIELEMLRDKMLNSRRDLVDELYGGDDPSLRNTKPIIDELRKMELKTFNESLGDQEELPPKLRLQVAAARVNISKGVTATVESDKQKDTETLNDAVSKYNAGIATQMTSMQQGVQALQEKHATEDEAIAAAEEEAAEAEAKVAKAQEPKSVDQQRLFNMNKYFQKRLDDDKELPESQLRIYNKLAKSLGEKPIIKRKGKKPRWTIPVLGWTFGEEKTTEYGTEEQDPLNIL